MKNELKVDFDTYKKHPKTPVFHKIKFSETSIYLTKSSFTDLITSENSNGYYRVFSWFDPRAREFLKLELGEKIRNYGGVRSLGFTELIGRFKPVEGDLEDVQYVSDSGKAYYKSAYDELNGVHNSQDENYKIDPESFMVMKEIIPTGAQGKAIYGDGNYIIDGPAGTGKSTTILQKIKILQSQESVISSDICVIVKNINVIKGFETLLKNIDIDDIKIFTVEDFFKEIDIADLDESQLNNAYERSSSIIESYKMSTDVNSRLISINDNKNSINDANLKAFLSDVPDLSELISVFINKCDSLYNLKRHNSKNINMIEKANRDELAALRISLKSDFLKKKKKTYGLQALRAMISSEGKGVLTLAEETEIRDIVFERKRRLDNSKNSKQKSNQAYEESAIRSLHGLLIELNNIFYSEDTFSKLSNSSLASLLMCRYANKARRFLKDYHTIIIDEAQDVSAVNLELIRLFGANVVLAGDELQCEDGDGVANWDNIIRKENFCKNEVLNIFKLRHNFRQTYELGSVSYNYRQLALGMNVVDIKDEYFENQKGFRIPRLELIENSDDFSRIVKNKLNYIQGSFSVRFPLVVFYENDKSLSKFIEIVTRECVSYEIDVGESQESSTDIVFVNRDNIAGREFPVVISPVGNLTSKSSIYIMISRAKFDLTIVTGSNKDINEHVMTLVEEGLIEMGGQEKFSGNKVRDHYAR